ncbi:sensor histidine kinase [Sphingomonas alpina]|uniref:histidine kinase n=1 Tax=Sphingomonas alpina TaxID=653931 RepID=A0A7H0LN42_9SPHN|nr:ATP-binding protein [Sphingomonas alpina]QNQ11095.1 GHKL domain-containing protein [Sphingomonas alpina]
MAFELRRRWTFTAQLAVRGLIAGCLGAAGLTLIATGRPVLGIIAWVLAILAAIDLVRVAAIAERATRDLIDQLSSGADDLPAGLPPSFAHLEASIIRAIDARHDRETCLRARIDADLALLDTVSAAIFVTGDDGVIVQSNRAARALATSSPGRFADHPSLLPEDVRALLSGRPEAGRVIRLADGRAAHASVALFDLPDGTRRRLIALHIIAESLGAVEIDAWHRLSRVLAHEMMNSLSPVISLADSLVSLARDPDADPDRSQSAAAAATIARRAQHLMGFVERYRQLLAMPEPELAQVPLEEFAEDLAVLTRALDTRVSVRTIIEPPDLTARIDRELIEQALLNLLKNAVEACRECEQPVVILRCSADTGEVEMAVEDNGVGLPDTVEDLFLPFFTTKADGAGIGLAIARQIAVAHNGNLLARRRTKGCIFALRVPADAPRHDAS